MPIPDSTRPLSPHIQIYRWTLTMLLSIAHRASGIVLYFGMFGLIAALVVVASGGEGGSEGYFYIKGLARSWFGQVILYGYLWIFLHHMFGGFRHFIWDLGKGFNLRHVDIMAWIGAVAPLFLTLLIWLMVGFLGGV